MNDRAEWRAQAQATTPSGYHFMFDGRTRFVASQVIAQNSATKNIEQTLRQSLLRTITYDKLDGLDGSSWLHQPSRGLLFATYQSCCWASGGQGLTGIGGDSSIPETPSWLDWHEYGHQFQMSWSWSDQEKLPSTFILSLHVTPHSAIPISKTVIVMKAFTVSVGINKLLALC